MVVEFWKGGRNVGDFFIRVREGWKGSQESLKFYVNIVVVRVKCYYIILQKGYLKFQKGVVIFLKIQNSQELYQIFNVLDLLFRCNY